MANKEFTRFKKLLRNSGYFVTAPRMYMFGILQNRPALTLKQLIKLSKKYNQTTVYRTINLFEKLGVVNRLQLGWNTKIELSDIFHHHHHHMTCSNCGKISILPEDKTIESRIELLSQITGYKITDHQLEVRGLCQNCQKT